MNTKNLPSKLLAAIGVLFTCGVLLTGASLPFSIVARDYSPRNQVAATADAEAIPLVLEPTRTWQKDVMPTQQAVEADEIGKTTRNEYKNKRTASDAWLWFRIGVGGLALCGAAMFVACAAVERAKRAAEYEPYQVLPNKPLYFPRRARATHALTTATWSLTTDHPADVQHGTLLIEGRAGARYRVTGRDRRLPVVVEGLRSVD